MSDGGVYRTVAVALVAIAALLALTVASNDAQQSIVIEEDDPRWDCETMGNKLCGPQVPTLILEKATS
jgi:hypothetical protein